MPLLPDLPPAGPPGGDAIRLAAGATDLAGTVVLAAAAAAALVALLRGRGVPAVRRTLANGAVTGLSVKTAATLLRTVELPTWDRFATLVAVLALRVFLKRVFAWELGRADPTRQ